MNTLTGSNIIVAISLWCAVTDLLSRKVYNKVLFTGMMGGVVLMATTQELHLLSFVGLILPLALHIVPFRLCLVSAGDVKLLMVVGFFSGAQAILFIMGASYMIGGILAILAMCRAGELKVRMGHLWAYGMRIMITRQIVKYDSPNSNIKPLPFAAMVHLAAWIHIVRF